MNETERILVPRRAYVLTVLRTWDDPGKSGLAVACRSLWSGYQQASGWRIGDADAVRGAAMLAKALRHINLRETLPHSSDRSIREDNVRQIILDNAPSEFA